MGIGRNVAKLTNKCTFEIQSLTSCFATTITCFTIDKITDALPNFSFNKTSVNIPINIKLADPKFNLSASIDILLGANTFWSILLSEQIKLGKNMPVIQNTHLGWIVSGPIRSIQSSACNHATFSFHVVDTLDQLRKFWEIEELHPSTALSVEEKMREDHFVENFTRDSDGRFKVDIPFKESPSKLGDTKRSSLKLFYQLERKLESNSSLKQYYCDFMAEYEALGHMSKVQTIIEPNFFLPHHGVLKETSKTAKLRVVFNGSAPSTSGWSRNKLQMVGPNIQQDLFLILLRFCKHRYVASADITKMYR